MAWNAMDALNRNTQAAVTDERPKARFRVRDINIKKMYSNDANFYSMQDVEQLAQKIYAVGLLENLTVVNDPVLSSIAWIMYHCQIFQQTYCTEDLCSKIGRASCRERV